MFKNILTMLICINVLTCYASSYTYSSTKYNSSISCKYDQYGNYITSGEYTYTINNSNTMSYIEPINIPDGIIINTNGSCDKNNQSKNPSCTIKFIKNNSESAIIKIQVNTYSGITELESINIPACKK